MQHPNIKMPEEALNAPIAFVQILHKGGDIKKPYWHVQKYEDINNAWKDFMDYKAMRPCMILNFGMIVVDNETPQ